MWLQPILDIDVSAEYDSAVRHWEVSDVNSVESYEVFTVLFYAVPRVQIIDVSVANVVQILYEGCSEGDLNKVSEEEHCVYESEFALPEQ